jgi:hypothetical protein
MAEVEAIVEGVETGENGFLEGRSGREEMVTKKGGRKTRKRTSEESRVTV